MHLFSMEKVFWHMMNRSLLPVKTMLVNLKCMTFIDALERNIQFMIHHPQQAWKNFIRFDTPLDYKFNRRPRNLLWVILRASQARWTELVMIALEISFSNAAKFNKCQYQSDVPLNWNEL